MFGNVTRTDDGRRGLSTLRLGEMTNGASNRTAFVAVTAAAVVVSSTLAWLFEGHRAGWYFTVSGIVLLLLVWWRHSRAEPTNVFSMRGNIIGSALAVSVGIAVASMPLYLGTGGWAADALSFVGGGLFIAAGVGGGIAYWALYERGSPNASSNRDSPPQS